MARNANFKNIISLDNLDSILIKRDSIMKIHFLIVFAFFVTSQLLAQDIDKNYKPKNLDEAILQLDKLFPDSTKQKIAQMEENDFLGNSHLSTGMWIRNIWGLWKGGELSKYFNELGIYHPDDMSGIILRSFYRHIKAQDYELDNQIKYYQDYWKKTQVHEYKMKNDTAYATKFNRENDSIYKETIREKTGDFKPGTRIRGWVNYSDGVFSGGRTQIEGEIIDWEGIKAKVKIDKFLDDKKKNRVLRYNKVKDNEIYVSYYLLEKI